MSDSSDGRHVQGIVGAVSRHDSGGQGHAQRVEDGSSNLELRSVRIVLAVSELQEALLGEDFGVAVGGGGIDADGVGGQVVDADGLLVEVVFEKAEVVRGGESVEAVGEAVVVEEDRQDGFAKEGREGMLVLGDPGADVVEAVIALGKQEKEPNGQDFARSEGSLPVERSREASVQIGRQIQTQKDGPQHR